MSILINDELLWVSIPRCASVSIEKALMGSDIPVRYIGDNYNEIIKKNIDNRKFPFHYHYPITELYKYFGYKDSICIKRDWFDCWLSSLEHIFEIIRFENFTPIVEWENIDNNFIYEVFNVNFSNDIYSGNEELTLKCYSKLILDDYQKIYDNSMMFRCMLILKSQNTWKNNTKCTYEFDITEIDKFENFIKERYNVDFNLPVINVSKKIKNKIIINDELKNWVWKMFEDPYIKRNSLI